MDDNTRPPRVFKLHYAFDGWLGDDLLESFPCYIITERLAEALKLSRLTGWSLGEVKVTKSHVFEDLYPDTSLPRFAWLIVDGKSSDDFSLDSKYRLQVSDEGLRLLQQFRIGNAEVRAVSV